MADNRWNQAQLAGRIGLSPSTVTRALASKHVSSGFRLRAEDLLRKHQPRSAARAPRDEASRSLQELHLLQKSYTLLQGIDSKLETLLAGKARVSGKRGT